MPECEHLKLQNCARTIALCGEGAGPSRTLLMGGVPTTVATTTTFFVGQPENQLTDLRRLGAGRHRAHRQRRSGGKASHQAPGRLWADARGEGVPI